MGKAEKIGYFPLNFEVSKPESNPWKFFGVLKQLLSVMLWKMLGFCWVICDALSISNLRTAFYSI